jgi:hypothetical protein
MSDAKDPVPLRTSAQFVRTYHAQAHDMTDAIAAALTNAPAGLNWLSAQPLDLEEVRKALNSIVVITTVSGHAKLSFDVERS